MIKISVLVSFLGNAILVHRFAYGFDCYQCTNVKNVTDCHNVVQCNADEIRSSCFYSLHKYCFTETTGVGQFTEFTLGCRSKQTCLDIGMTTTTDITLETSTATSTEALPVLIVGRSVAQTIDCKQCCAVDACNKQLCTTGTQVLPSLECQDDPMFNCPAVASVFDICNDRHHAKLKCKKFCGLCNITDGQWSDWQSWSSCSVSCGPGTQQRTRACDDPAPRDGGLPCIGDSSEQSGCNLRTCPVHGSWSSWSSWGMCSVTCGIGLQRRDRTCSNPYPGPDGDHCYGDSRDDRPCFVRACADGNWSEWSSWGGCSASCLGGIKSRSRTCTNPVPSTFGHDCVGNSKETISCNTTNCPETNGGWTAWSSWSSCISNTRRRTRTCSDPIPSLHGRGCIGNSETVEFCGHSATYPPIRLINGSSPLSGRLEVFYSKWGTVCDDGFDINDALVICRMLNIETSQPYTKANAFYGQGSLPIILDDLNCHGLEPSIITCPHMAWLGHDCVHAEDAGVVCAPKIRLVGGANNQSGRVEVKYNGVWGTVCKDGFDMNAAHVVCRSLRISSGHISYNTSNPGSGAIHLDDVVCTGMEQSLEECRHKPWGVHNCNHDKDISVYCTR